MKIFFYPPFKPLDHTSPSGDLTTARGLVEYFIGRGHQVETASTVRCRWIYWKPWLLPGILRERQKAFFNLQKGRPDLWLTYHTYYKAPDVIGPAACSRADVPYVIFQGMYSTKRRRDVKTLPGFFLNRRALLAASHIFVNRLEDKHNLKRIRPGDCLSYVKPGIRPECFSYDPGAREKYRRQWRAGDKPVILSAAMFRADVKTKGLLWVIEACGRLQAQGESFILAIAGDGRERDRLKTHAARHLGENVRFIGALPREDMAGFYSAGDIFAFPGFRESLGMVYLEAQACGLPVAALDNGGIPEVVQHGRTGFLTPLGSREDYGQAIKKLLNDESLRQGMGRAAGEYVREFHDLNKNYGRMEDRLLEIAGRSIRPV